MVALAGKPVVFFQAPLRPPVRAGDGFLLVGARVNERSQLVEGEHDVRAQPMLNLHGLFGRKAVLGAIDNRAKVHAFLIYLGHALPFRGPNILFGEIRQVHGDDLFKAHTQRHHLESAGIGVGRPVPVLEFRHAAGLVHDVVARLQVEMIGIGQNGLRSGGANLLRRQGLYRGLGRHRDKRRGGDIAVRGVDNTTAAMLAGAFGQALIDVET